MFNHQSITFALLFASLNLLTSAAYAATGTVISTLDAAGYTYVEVDTGDEKIWMAGPKTALAKGSMVTVNTSKPMRDFHSKTLNRDFPVVYFVDRFTDSDVGSDQSYKAGHGMVPKTRTLKQPLERADGGQTIAEVIAGKKEFSGKTVKVRGQITQYTANIKGKNWIHIIDGSTDKDLTVISQDSAEKGNIVVIEGKLVLDLDFGYGYFYELVVDEAKLTVE